MHTTPDPIPHSLSFGEAVAVDSEINKSFAFASRVTTGDYCCCDREGGGGGLVSTDRAGGFWGVHGCFGRLVG